MEFKDLEFLQYCKTEDLQILVDYLTKNKKGNFHITEKLTESKEYQSYYPKNLPKMWQEISKELQRYGGNTLVNFIRDKGVPYKEIVMDVATKINVNFDKNESVEQLEVKIIFQLLEQSTNKLGKEQLKVFLQEFDIDCSEVKDEELKNYAIGKIKHSFYSNDINKYNLTSIVANQTAMALLGRGLSFSPKLVNDLTKSLYIGIFGIISAILLTLKLLSPNYNITIPSVVQIAYMRMKFYKPKGFIEYKE